MWSEPGLWTERINRLRRSCTSHIFPWLDTVEYSTGMSYMYIFLHCFGGMLRNMYDKIRRRVSSNRNLALYIDGPFWRISRGRQKRFDRFHANNPQRTLALKLTARKGCPSLTSVTRKDVLERGSSVPFRGLEYTVMGQKHESMSDAQRSTNSTQSQLTTDFSAERYGGHCTVCTVPLNRS